MKNLFLTNIIITIFLSFTVNLYSQFNIQDIADPNGGDFIHHSIVEYEESYIVVGTVTPGPGFGNLDILLMRLDINGDVLWSQYLYVDTGLDEELFVGSVIVDNDNNIVLVGHYLQPPVSGAPKKLLFIGKFTENGSLINYTLLDFCCDNMNFYGFDIEHTSNGNYIVVGLASNDFGTDINSYKFSYVLGIEDGLDTLPYFVNFYSSFENDPNWRDNYDSFNHVLKIPEHPLYDEELFFITGNAAFDAPLIHNVLLDEYGNEKWNYTYVTSGIGVNGAVSSLYNKERNEFYVLYNASSFSMITVLDGSTGSVKDIMSLRNLQSNPIMLNGMEWSDSEQNSIIFSGYNLHSIYDKGNAILININIYEKELIWAFNYPNEFSISDYSILFPVDEIIQPLNGFTSQLFYQSKPLIKTKFDPSGFKYCAVTQFDKSMGLSLITTDLNGFTGDDNCLMELEIEIRDEIGYLYSSLESQSFLFAHFRVDFQQLFIEMPYRFNCIAPSKSEKIQEKNNRHGLLIYPNPFDSFVNISSVETVENIKVYNLNGQIIDIPFKYNTLDFSTLSSGIYLIEIEIDGNKEIFRVIKK